MAAPRRRIGELLVRLGYTSGLAVRQALAVQRRWGGSLSDGGEWLLGEVLVELGTCDEEQVARTLSMQANLKYCPVERLDLPPTAISKIPVEIAVERGVVPLAEKDGTLVVAFHSPPDFFQLDNLRFQVGCEIDPVLASERGIRRVIERVYGHRFDPVRAHGGDDLLNTAHGLLTQPLRRSDGAVLVDLRPGHLRIRFALGGRDVDHEVPLEADRQQRLLGALGLETLLRVGRRSFEVLPVTLDDRELELMIVSQPHERGGVSLSLQRLNP